MGEKLPTTRQEAIDLLKTEGQLSETQKEAMALLFENPVEHSEWVASTEWDESWESSAES